MKEYSFLNSSIWIDDSFLGMSPEQKLVMIYLLTNPYSNWCGIYKLPLTTMANQLGLKERGLDSSFFAFAGQYKDLVLFDEDTKEIAILNWANMCLTKVSDNTVKAARKELAYVESQKLIWAMASKTKSAGLKKIYSDAARTLQLANNSAQESEENHLTINSPENLHNSLTDNDLWSSSSSMGNGRVVLLEKEPKLSTSSDFETGSTNLQATGAVKEQSAAVNSSPPSSAAPLPTWSELLRRKSRPSKGFSAAMTPNPAGNDWERRLHVFDAVRRKYPGTKSGLSVEFDQFLARAHENKIQDIDAELRQMPYAVLYQIKWNEVKKDEGGFVPNWKNFSTWLSKMCWQSDMEAWKSRSEWFNQMCPENTKEAVEALKSILPCK